MSFEKNKGGEERERDMGLDEGEREQTLTPFVISNELIGHVCCMRPLSMCHFNVLPPNLVCSNSGKPVCSKSLSSGLYLIYALASTNNNKQNNFSIPIFFSDSLIEKKSTHSQIKYFNQNWKSKHTQKSLKFENIKKNNKKINT